MLGIHIDEDAVERRDCKVDWVRETWYTPDEAVGELVEFEMPGTMGEEVYRIVDVNPDDKETTVRKLRNGSTYKIEDDFLPPNWDHFSRPKMGSEHTLYWKEHLTGGGEWVRTTPKLDSKRSAQKYYGGYEGHEKTRLVNMTATYTPPGITEVDIRLSRGELTIFKEDEPEQLQAAFDQIKDDIEDTYDTLGHVYINQDNEVVWYSIETEYTKDNWSTPFDALDDPIM